MRLPWPVAVIAALFAAAIVLLLVTALVPRQVATYTPSPAPTPPGAMPPGDTVTLDARDPDRWRYFSFTRGLLESPDTAGWELSARRFHVRVAGLLESPGSATHPGAIEIGRWYRYSMFSHLLVPKPGAYLVQSRDGGLVRLEFLSYYCPGPEAGCL